LVLPEYTPTDITQQKLITGSQTFCHNMHQLAHTIDIQTLYAKLSNDHISRTYQKKSKQSSHDPSVFTLLLNGKCNKTGMENTQ
jgi:hypothetical protein